jgi:DNA-binding LytR/AlgR family response regulator
MIKAIALDDEPPALQILSRFCAQSQNVELEKIFSKPQEALKYLEQFPVDLIFLDVQMPSLTGIEFYKMVKQETMVIFTTAFSEYAVEGFNLKAVDYLLKPFSYERFLAAVEKATEYHDFLHNKPRVDSEQYLFVRADYSLIKIKMSDIQLIEGLDDYLKIHLSNGKIIVTRMTMKVIQEKLPAHEFIRVHRSYIVPFSKVDVVRNKVISIGGKEVPIGNSYEENVNKLLKG